MPSVLVSKLGAVLRQNATSPMGEQGETMSIIKHLAASGWDVIYFGRYLGSKPLEGVIHVEPEINGIDQYMTIAQQEARFAEDVKKLTKVFSEVGKPKYAVQTCGYAAPRSVMSHYPGGSLQVPSLRYSAPQINACHFFGIERITVNTDVSTVSCNREMNLWPDVIPCCVLSQRDRVSKRVIGGQRYRIEEVYCGSENWIRDDVRCFKPNVTNAAGAATIVALAHSWIRKNDHSVKTWQKLLGPGVDIIGDEWSGVDTKGAAKLGHRKPCVLSEVLKKYKYGLCVSNAKNWYSPKIKEYLVNGIIPLVCDFGKGRVDTACRYLSETSVLRVKSYDEICKVDYCDAVKASGILLGKLKADFSFLDRSLAGERIGIYRKGM